MEGVRWGSIGDLWRQCTSGIGQGCVLYLQFTCHVMADIVVRASCPQIANHESRITNRQSFRRP
jgi:hypothetical protein